MEPHDVRAAWARVVALAASAVSGLYLLVVLGFGAIWVTMDWSALDCFDGDEPACTDPPDSGLTTVQASSWVLGVLAVLATLGAIVLALRMRRVAHVVPVLALCVSGAAAAQLLWARL